MSKERVGIYPGTFDPIHNGHLDVIRRATFMMDRLIVAVASNIGKGPMFTPEERVAMVRADIDALVAAKKTNGTRIDVIPFSGLLVHFCVEHGAQVIVRGLRAVSDFEFEFQMAANNKRLVGQIETIFLMASENTQWTSSRFVKEIHRLGGDVSSFVSSAVLAQLDERREQR